MVTTYIRSMRKKAKERQSDKMTWKRLRKADRLFPMPFELTLLDHTSTLMCEEIARILPKKRLVAFGIWEDKPVVAKLFYDPRRSKRNFEKDVTGVEVLQKSGIPTPAILYKGSTRDKRIKIIIFERILESQNLFDIWQNKKSLHEIQPLMHNVTLELATQHVLGVIQSDLHLKNFLVAKNQIYTLDGGSIEHIQGILSKEESLDYLALFFAQLGVDSSDLQEYLFNVYSKSRGWIVRPADRILLKKQVAKWNKSRWLRFQKKIFRNCTAFSRRKTSRHLIIFDREYQSANFLEFLKDPDSYFARENTQLLKAGNSSTVIKATIDDHQFVIKRYNLKNFWHRLRRCFRETRAAASWRLANQLLLSGVDTAKPVAFIENRFFGLRGKSYFVMETIKGPDLAKYFADHKEEAIRSEMANTVMSLLRNLAKLHMTHGDLKVTNILIENEKPFLIDLDGMKQHLSWFGLNYAWKKEVKRFLRNWDNFPSIKALFERISIL